jgi:hypothetical protein
MVNEANRPTSGATPEMIENEIASGISASATTIPASSSVRAVRSIEEYTYQPISERFVRT